MGNEKGQKSIKKLKIGRQDLHGPGLLIAGVMWNFFKRETIKKNRQSILELRIFKIFPMVKNRQPNYNSGKDSGNLCKIKQMGKGHTQKEGRSEILKVQMSRKRRIFYIFSKSRYFKKISYFKDYKFFTLISFYLGNSIN